MANKSVLKLHQKKVIDVTEYTTYTVKDGLSSPGTVIQHDGLQKNIRLLGDLSEKIDQYFAMQTLAITTGMDEMNESVAMR